MADIAFDEPTATTLADAFRGVAAMLQRAGWERSAAVDAACVDFRGGYATRFTDACAIESDDRGKLSGKLDDLADLVDKAIAAAAKERERIAAHEAWEARVEAAEALRRQTLGLYGASQAETFVGVEPETTPVRPPTITAAFAPKGRGRYSSAAGAGGTTSADPVTLRGFVQRSQTITGLMREGQTALHKAVSSYASACSWAPTAVVTLLDGFSRFIDENVTDERWIASIAEAFELAGSGTLDDFDIMLAISAGHPKVLERALFDANLSPEDVAKVWALLAATKGFNLEKFVERYAFELASLNGIPFAVMDQAGQYALTWALDPDHPENLAAAYAKLGLNWWDMSLDDFKLDLEGIRAGLKDAKKLADGDPVLLLSFGVHDGAVTAGISMGDLDQAKQVGLFASGMGSNVRELGDTLDAFKKIRADDPNFAMVTWIGYRAPNVAEEMWQDRADSGALRMSSFLDGIAAQRGKSIDRFVTIGHSYGTNVLAEALKTTSAKVDAFVTLGSAGLKYGTTTADLQALSDAKGTKIYATHADGDGIAAGAGQHLHFRSAAEDGGGAYEKREDPRELPGAYVFSSEKTERGKQVTMHNLLHPIDWKSIPVAGGPLQWAADTFDGVRAEDEIGYMNPESSTVGALWDIMRGEEPIK
ncbi:putative esterase [Leucobacter komagatae]|uniref:Putative esterase n=1 Tax=Leucobacter komagatae TaxID=55969 RepID=A0A542Y1W3_9MICO|nr:alpha/beta hydrolase [Leucobacter komagatae]TQL42072.1 putative esterase [Leucobacter komagatae]